MLTDLQAVYISQDKDSSHPEEYQIKKTESESSIWWSDAETGSNKHDYEEQDYEYSEGSWCNITYSNNTKPTASALAWHGTVP